LVQIGRNGERGGNKKEGRMEMNGIGYSHRKGIGEWAIFKWGKVEEVLVGKL
jgi:hypothetical protein